ncbi:hypothetical protein POTOM_034342 [Populus tomentosa]|uniref:Uncharacterized protein n=1 Tax=Populus tomentosa TaxID=118781 RepID=A0A8X7Z2E1_POPTO|nr:hypothetical protein POTOM_034342 [Populus tomentosa]
MDEQEFRRLLDLFPVVRPRNYHIEIYPSRQSSSRSFPEPFKSWKEAEWEEDKKEINNQAIDVQGMLSNKIFHFGRVFLSGYVDAFWEKLKLAVEKKAFGALRNSFFNNSKHGGYLSREKELTLCDFTWLVTCESELNLSRCLYLTPVFGFSPSCISDLFVDRLFPIECCAKKVLTDLYLSAIMHYAKKKSVSPHPNEAAQQTYRFLVIVINEFFVDDKFWSALVDIQVGAAEAERFSKAFHEVHRKLVYEELSLDAAFRSISSSKISRQ